MTRGRKPHVDPPVNVMVSIPSSLNTKIELLLYDPVSMRPKYGGRSELIQTLLYAWIELQQKQALAHIEPKPKDSLDSGP